MSNYSTSRFNRDDQNTSWQKTFNLVPAGTLVLDVGCSSGTFGARLIKEKGCIVDGVEIDANDFIKAEKVLRKVYKFNIETDDLHIPEKYDIVFMGDVVEHLARPIDALKKIKKLLKPEGRLIFSLPNITHMSVRMMLLSGKVEYGRTGLLDETHLHFYNREEIYRVFNAAGFEIEIFDYTINDWPEPVIRAELEKIGLRMRPKFLEIVRSTNGAAYQFIGIAKRGAVKKQHLPSSSPLNVVDTYTREVKKNYEDTIKAIIADRDRILADKNKLEEELNAYSVRIAYKTSQKIRGIKRRVTSKRGSGK